jgi:plastocyanin
VTFQFDGFHTATFSGGRSPAPLFVPAGNLKQPQATDAAGNSMWWVGKAPVLGINPAAVPQIGGATISSPSQVRSSGVGRILASGNHQPKPYTLTFLKPGVYHFYCVIHPGMTGVIHVLSKTATAPSAAANAKAVQQQAAHVISSLRSIQSAKPTEKLTMWVGNGTFDGANITAFFPKRLVVNTGDTVKFLMHDISDPHTVTFGPDPYTGQIEKTFIGPKGTLNPFGGFPSEPPGPPSPVPYDGSNHGNGYINSGVLNPYASKQQGPHLFRVTFTKPGVYHLECVIHQNMDATIIVR